MTAPNGPILFHSSAGSDTQSSGLGPSTAVYGAGASTTAASAVVTGIDTTGVSVGDLLWVQSSSDRQFSIIASVDSSTQVTCDDVFANTESSRTWAVGGKRATFDGAVQLFRDWHGGWIIETETDQTVSVDLRAAAVGGDVDNYAVIRCNNKKITKAFAVFWTPTLPFREYTIIQDAILTTSIASNGVLIGTTGLAGDSPLRHLINVHIDPTIDGGTGTYGVYVGQGMTAYRCSFKNSTYGVYATFPCTVNSCIFESNATGLWGSHQLSPQNSIFINNTSHGVEHAGATRYFTATGNISYGNSGDGLRIAGRLGTFGMFTSNIAVNNGGYGINITNTNYSLKTTLNCATYNNTSGGINGSLQQINNVALTADPFVDAANGDFNLNAINGGGGTLRSKNYTLGG